MEIEATFGENPFLGYAMEDACLYAYHVIKIEEANKRKLRTENLIKK